MPDLPLLLTRSQAAALLGVSSSTFSAWVAAGVMPRPIEGTKRWSRVQIERASSGQEWIPLDVHLPPEQEQLTWASWKSKNAERDKHKPLFDLNKRQEYALRHLFEHDFSDGTGVRGAGERTFEELVERDLAKAVRGGWRITPQGQSEIIRTDTWRNWRSS